MVDDFARCLVSNTRMAARAVTRRYDGYLRPHGVTATQFSLLGAIATMPGATVTALADARGFERTTLTRNLDKLEAMGLVRTAPPARGNGRLSEVTPAGRAMIRRLVPLWRQAQADMEAQLSPPAFEQSLGVLKRLAKV